MVLESDRLEFIAPNVGGYVCPEIILVRILD